MKYNIDNAIQHTVSQVVANKKHWLYVGYAYVCVPLVALLVALILTPFGTSNDYFETCSVIFFLSIRYGFLLLGWYTFGWLSAAFLQGISTK